MGKKHTEKRQPTAEDKRRNAEHKFKRFISEAAVELADRDPETKRQMVAQTFGFALPDPAERKRRELVALIDKLAMQRILDDPELARRITDARISQIAEELGLKAKGEEWREKPHSITELIGQAREVNELKEVLGIKKPGLLESILQPEVIAAILSAIPALLSNKQPRVRNREIVLLQENGEERLMTEAEYQALIAQSQIKSLGNATIAEPKDRCEDNEATPESETSNKAEGGDTGTVDSGE